LEEPRLLKKNQTKIIVARDRSLAIGYIQHAISLIDKLKKLKEEGGTK
jgi:hypothetical protein